MKTSRKIFARAQSQRCPLCAKVFPNVAELENHISSHTKEKPFKCDHCHFKTAYKQHLQRHFEKNHEDPSVWDKRLKFKCEQCPYKTYQNFRLRRHMLKHTGERNFPCKFADCIYKGKSATAQQRHCKRVHSDERPWPCRIKGCPYRGKLQDDITQDMIKHSTERPFRCSQANCDYKANNRNLLNVHLKLTHGKARYECSFAG